MINLSVPNNPEKLVISLHAFHNVAINNFFSLKRGPSKIKYVRRLLLDHDLWPFKNWSQEIQIKWSFFNFSLLYQVSAILDKHSEVCNRLTYWLWYWFLAIGQIQSHWIYSILKPRMYIFCNRRCSPCIFVLLIEWNNMNKNTQTLIFFFNFLDQHVSLMQKSSWSILLYLWGNFVCEAENNHYKQHCESLWALLWL